MVIPMKMPTELISVMPVIFSVKARHLFAVFNGIKDNTHLLFVVMCWCFVYWCHIHHSVVMRRITQHSIGAANAARLIRRCTAKAAGSGPMPPSPVISPARSRCASGPSAISQGSVSEGSAPFVHRRETGSLGGTTIHSIRFASLTAEFSRYEYTTSHGQSLFTDARSFPSSSNMQ